MKSPAELHGLEHDWLAIDEQGHVALFSTAGGSPAPATLLRDPDAHDAAITAILALPPSTAARFAPSLAPDLENTWKEVAERGLFAFDGDPNGGPYHLVAAPVVPARLDSLPAPARDVASRHRLPMRFEALAVDVRLTEEDLRRIQRLCEAATGGPWKAYVEGRDHDSGSSFIRTAREDIELSGATEQDFDFIASARQDVPRLLAEVRALRAALERARGR